MLFVFAVRKSIAKWMPFSSRPGIGRSRGLVAPVARTTAWKSLQLFRWIIFPDLGVANKFDAFGFENFQAAQHDFVFIELHVRDAIHEQAAGTVGTLEHGDQMAGAVELRGGGESRRAGTDD